MLSNAPDAVLVFDHFHLVKFNYVLDEIRKGVYRDEKDLNKPKMLKETRWLLLCNGKYIFDKKFKNTLKMNESLMKVYYLKDNMKETWMQVNKENAKEFIINWSGQAYQPKRYKRL